MSKPDWYLVDGVAKFWDGEKLRRFKWTESEGWYEFQGVSHYWNGIHWNDEISSRSSQYLVTEKVTKELKPKGLSRLKLSFMVYFIYLIIFLGIVGLGAGIISVVTTESTPTCNQECQLQIFEEEQSQFNEEELDRIKQEVFCDNTGRC